MSFRHFHPLHFPIHHHFLSLQTPADPPFLLTRPHSLRYTLKNKETNTELFVVVIQLCPTEQAVKEGAKSAEQEFEETHGKMAGSTAEAKGGDEDLD